MKPEFPPVKLKANKTGDSVLSNPPQVHAASTKEVEEEEKYDERRCNLNQLLAAIGINYLPQVLQKSSTFELNFLSSDASLEASIAGSANWKLSLAASSVGDRITKFRS